MFASGRPGKAGGKIPFKPEDLRIRGADDVDSSSKSGEDKMRSPSSISEVRKTTLGRAIYFTGSIDSNANLIWKEPQRHTQTYCARWAPVAHSSRYVRLIITVPSERFWKLQEQSEEITEGQLISKNLIYQEGNVEPMDFFQRNYKIRTGLLEDSWPPWFGERRGRRGDQLVEYYNSQRET